MEGHNKKKKPTYLPSNHQDKFSFKNTQISEDTVEAEKKLNHFYNLTDYNEVKDTVIKHLLITKINNELKISGEFVIR